MTKEFDPLIIGFTCNWCSYRAADMAGTARLKYPHNIRLIRLMYSLLLYKPTQLIYLREVLHMKPIKSLNKPMQINKYVSC